MYDLRLSGAQRCRRRPRLHQPELRLRRSLGKGTLGCGGATKRRSEAAHPERLRERQRPPLLGRHSGIPLLTAKDKAPGRLKELILNSPQLSSAAVSTSPEYEVVISRGVGQDRERATWTTASGRGSRLKRFPFGLLHGELAACAKCCRPIS